MHVTLLTVFLSSFFAFQNIAYTKENDNKSKRALNNKAKNYIKQYESRHYNLKRQGLRDLAVEVRSSLLSEEFSKNPLFKSYKDIHFKAYWMLPNKYGIEVVGLPKGRFKELRKGLKRLVVTRLNFLIPLPLSEKLKDYQMKFLSRRNGATKIVASNADRVVNKIILGFQKNQLTSIKKFRPIGQEDATLSYKIYNDWSDNKWVLNKYEVASYLGVQKTTVTNNLVYKKQGSYGVLSKLVSNTKQVTLQPGKGKEDTFQRNLSHVLEFRNYQLNKRVAELYFKNQKKNRR